MWPTIGWPLQIGGLHLHRSLETALELFSTMFLLQYLSIFNPLSIFILPVPEPPGGELMSHWNFNGGWGRDASYSTLNWQTPRYLHHLKVNTAWTSFPKEKIIHLYLNTWVFSSWWVPSLYFYIFTYMFWRKVLRFYIILVQVVSVKEILYNRTRKLC